MGSLSFRLQIKTEPKLSIAGDGAMVLPEFYTGHDGVDAVIRKAWLGQYNSTKDMLKDLEDLQPHIIKYDCEPFSRLESRQSLRSQVRHWREQWKKNVGKHPTRCGRIVPFRLCLL